MEASVSEIKFTERETQVYGSEFDQQTSDQRKPLAERVTFTQQMMGQTANVYFNKLFRRKPIPNRDLAIIWELASEGQTYLKLPNFIAAMRLCSAYLAGKKTLTRNLMFQSNLHVGQPVISRKSTVTKVQDLESVRAHNSKETRDNKAGAIKDPEFNEDLAAFDVPDIRDSDDTMQTVMVTSENAYFTPQSSEIRSEERKASVFDSGDRKELAQVQGASAKRLSLQVESKIVPVIVDRRSQPAPRDSGIKPSVVDPSSLKAKSKTPSETSINQRNSASSDRPRAPDHNRPLKDSSEQRRDSDLNEISPISFDLPSFEGSARPTDSSTGKSTSSNRASLSENPKLEAESLEDVFDRPELLGKETDSAAQRSGDQEVPDLDSIERASASTGLMNQLLEAEGSRSGSDRIPQVYSSLGKAEKFPKISNPLPMTDNFREVAKASTSLDRLPIATEVPGPLDRFPMKTMPVIPISKVFSPSTEERPKVIQRASNAPASTNYFPEATGVLEDCVVELDLTEQPDIPLPSRPETKLTPRSANQFERTSVELSPREPRKSHERIRSIKDRPSAVYEAPPELKVSIPRYRHVTTGWFGASSYVSYDVVSSQGDLVSSVERRFSDFDWLHTQLTEKYKGLIIPPRPEKKVFGSTTEKFVEERRSQIENYLEILASHPIISHSQLLKCFLTTPAEIFDREKEKLESNKAWLEFSGIEDTVDLVWASLKSRLNQFYTTNMQTFSAAISEAEQQLNKISGPTQTFSVAFSSWVNSHNETAIAQLKLKFLDTTDHILMMDNYEDLVMAEMKPWKDFNMRIRDEMLRVEGLRNAVDSYKEKRDEHSKYEFLENIKITKQSACVDEDSRARYVSDSIKTQKEIENILSQLKEIELNIVNETSQFYERRTESLARTLTEATKFAVNSARKETQFWRANCDKFHL